MKLLYSLIAIAFFSLSVAQAQSENPTIRIRSQSSINNSEPLFVLNGVPIKKGQMKDLEPEQIEKIEVLKGARASAIYGSRGANGVIVIYTKGWMKEEASKERNKAEQAKLETEDNGVEEEASTSIHLFPNPVSTKLNFCFTLDSPQKVKATIYGLDGRLIDTAFEGSLDAASYQESWDSSQLTPGVYFFRLHIGDKMEVKPFIVH